MMRFAASVFAVFCFLTAAPGPVHAEETLSCDEARCLFQEEIDSKCSCENARNHGQYVKCVGRVIRNLTRDGQISQRCRGKLVRCAARSTCGKADFVTCTIQRLGVCNETSFTCEDFGDEPVACASNADCVRRSKCRTKRTAEKCEARGGLVNESPTCCSSCVIEPDPVPAP